MPQRRIHSDEGRSAIVWFQMDLRLSDNPALAAASATGLKLIPLYIWSPEEEGDWKPGAASNVWLHQSLQCLDDELAKRGSKLILRVGRALDVLTEVIRESRAVSVFWNRRYEPVAIARDARVLSQLQGNGIEAQSFNAALLFDPWSVRTKEGKPFQVFTAFWNSCLKLPEGPVPLKAPSRLRAPTRWPKSDPLTTLGLLPRVRWDMGIRAAWAPGEAGAHIALKRFLTNALENYSDGRDRPAAGNTSRLSPHLHFGEIGPRQVCNELKMFRAANYQKGSDRNAETYLREIGWREFAHHVLVHFPHTTNRPLREKFDAFPWQSDECGLRAWQNGRTGYPIVDAGMRELWQTGWMHNRVRMVVASFLTKDLLLPWQAGSRWFWDTLVDADLANNTFGCQWTAGCGADAAPYFRIFNPTSQGEKFDPDGEYVRRYCPELSQLPRDYVHKPWEAPSAVLKCANVLLGKTYPKRIVFHDEARKRALVLFQPFK
jgi:deoxyribodipyrimidine photo-lyase